MSMWRIRRLSSCSLHYYSVHCIAQMPNSSWPACIWDTKRTTEYKTWATPPAGQRLKVMRSVNICCTLQYSEYSVHAVSSPFSSVHLQFRLLQRTTCLRERQDLHSWERLLYLTLRFTALLYHDLCLLLASNDRLLQLYLRLRFEVLNSLFSRVLNFLNLPSSRWH